ncbi:MAG: hypothetical protein ACRDP5_28350 [Streptosporangiaceae bacterium]
MATDTGSPVHVPYIHRTGVPARSHNSSPTIDQDDPEPFVFDSTVELLDVAPPPDVVGVVNEQFDPPVA